MNRVVHDHGEFTGLTDDDHTQYGWRLPTKFALLSGTQYLGLPGLVSTSGGTNTVVANQIRYSPILARASLTVDALYTEVTVAASSGKVARMGIYNADTHWQPTTLVVDAGEVAIDSTGVKSASISVTLAPGRYLSAFHINEGATFRAFRAGSRFTGIPLAMAGNWITIFSKSLTYTTLASTGVAWDNATSDTQVMLHYFVYRVTGAS